MSERDSKGGARKALLTKVLALATTVGVSPSAAAEQPGGEAAQSQLIFIRAVVMSGMELEIENPILQQIIQSAQLEEKTISTSVAAEHVNSFANCYGGCSKHTNTGGHTNTLP